MNAEIFYDQFKEALKYLGVAWGDKYLVTVSVVGRSVRFSYLGKECGFEI